ncbi:hypothetical protein CALVIDRAFT_292000 [Calocera viscosa TUFC12733]|uniref:Uncharacterized protein n=1 Tax=Calocera viscosa (strain TUFC12733) TaxID=1330018 RepID=A0A167IKQ1_CALVF|nr:hypothetical protein CALVIDRAFT_292000 [Calocera viscosa TUFC12733]
MMTAPHPFSLPATPTTPSLSLSRSQSTHPFASSWALKNAAPPISPGHLRSHSALPALASVSAPTGTAGEGKDTLRSFTPLSPEEDGEDDEMTPTAERVRPRSDAQLVEAEPLSPTAHPARPTSQPTFSFSLSDDEDDPYLLSAIHNTNTTLLHKRSMSTASSASSISLPLPYRPSISSDTSPLLPNLPPTPAELSRPRTTNVLDPIQKEMLRRRTRKLEQLLGTTHFAAGASEDEAGPAPCRASKGDIGKELLDRRPSTAGARLVRSRTASGPPTVKGKSNRFPLPLSPLPRIASISTLNSDGKPVSLSPSLSVSSDWEDDPAEKDKRRRRHTLQKIHRYLGVVVPAEIVAPSSNGLGTPLPLPADPPSTSSPNWPWAEDKKVGWKTLFTRSSGAPKLDEPVWKPSAVGVGVGTRRVVPTLQDPGLYSSPLERARNVKRAAKMEQLFGSPPPPALYLARPAGTPLSPALDSPVSPKSPLVPGMRRRAKSHDSPSRPMMQGIIVTTEEEVELDEPSPIYVPLPPVGLGIGPKHQRDRLWSDGDVIDISAEGMEVGGEVGEFGEVDAAQKEGKSFKSYRRSLASLDYLTQAGNRDSLASLLQYISESDDQDAHDPFATPSGASLRSPAPSQARSMTSTTATSGNLSIIPPNPNAQDPETASLISLAPSSPDPGEVAPAPPAWKRAAKLRKFFGVSYRELFDQLLERIEAGAREDMDRGALTKEEFDVVVGELRALRERREGLSSDLLR